jgi:hypothetical protein
MLCPVGINLSSLSEAKDLRRCFKIKRNLVVLNEDIGRNQESAT